MQPAPSNSWGDLDGRLSHMAKKATVQGGLVLTPKQWRENRLLEPFLPEFRKVCKINTDSFGVDTL